MERAGHTARRAGPPGAGREHQATAETNGPDGDAALRRELTELRAQVGRLEGLLRERSTKLEDVAKRLHRLERRIERASASFPVRTALSLRRRLHRLLK